jgi:hydroxymethylbilane synthase
MNNRLVIGSRRSQLAVAQAELVRLRLCELHPEMDVEIKTYQTTGDQILDRRLSEAGGKGLFTKELELALMKGDADLLVHSFKDVPMEVDKRIPIVGVTAREDERDVLVLPEGARGFDESKPIGCSSLRRELQLKRLYPEAKVESVRGNVLTRLRKLDEGGYGALCLAAAGLKRLGLEGRIWRYFSVDEMLPAACQGILALQARAAFDRTLLRGLHDKDAWDEATAERAFVRELDGGCSSPIAAHAVLENNLLRLTGLNVWKDGSLKFGTLDGSREWGRALGVELAEKMREGGLAR